MSKYVTLKLQTFS